MARYSIDETTLTALGDAVRSKVGATELREFTVTSATYTLEHQSTNPLYIPVCGATEIKIVKLNTTGTNDAIYLLNATCDNMSFSYVTKFDFIITNFTADSVGMYFLGGNVTYEFEAFWYDADGNQMEVTIDKEVQKTMTPERMATEIKEILKLDSSLLELTGDLGYKFYGNNWNDFIELYGDKITTNGVSSLANAFNMSNKLQCIPFEINCSDESVSAESMCGSCYELREPPVINNLIPDSVRQMFKDCRNIRYFPEDYGEDWDWSFQTLATSQYRGYRNGIVDACYSLRKLPMGLFKYGNPALNATYTSLKEFRNLYSLDEVVDMPFPHDTACKGTSSSGLFYNSFTGLYRCKEFTFAPDIGVKKWAKQVLDLSSSFGVLPDSGEKYILNYNSGITADKAVTNDTTYQALKNDPDWYAVYTPYSRYNHDSAVNTINSLPDCSEYAAGNGGSNTIKFKGAAGEKTDGGAINTLTDEEIAVAAAKGWTVTLV